jgi:hypothetical protein
MSLIELALLDGRRHLLLGDVIGLTLTFVFAINSPKYADIQVQKEFC